MKKLSVICPAYNEEAVIGEFYKALSGALDGLAGYGSEIIFVVDGGDDKTFEILSDIASRDRRVRVLKFSRNFGHQMALLAGVDYAEGDAVVMMDADLQHPPRLIAELLSEYEKGNDVVYTVRIGEKVGVLRKAAGALFYRMVNAVSEVHVVENASDFRLLSGRVARVLREDVRERDMFLRGMIQWLGFRQARVDFTPDARAAGRSKYSLGKLLLLALSGSVSFSKKPLRAASVLGVFLAAFGFLFALYTVGEYFASKTLPPGWATLTVLVSVFGGIQLIVLGIIGEYLGVIFDEVKARPRYIIERAVNVGRHANGAHE
jgi:dolichol-phosphate mannosyltransferase